MDFVIKENFKTVNDIFTFWTYTNHVKEERNLSLQEFISLVQASGVVNETFSTKEIGPLFNISIQTQVDEISSERHMKMTLFEFFEAIARISEKVIDSPQK